MTPSPLSRGDYDVRAALPRIHALLDKHEIPATLIAAGKLAPRTHARLPLGEAAEAQRMIEKREQFGKVLLLP